MPPPVVSVLIPSYNHGQFLRQTLASVLTQTVTNIEILIIDDGSSDDSVAIIADAASKDARIRAWQQPNMGLVATLNSLAKKARAPFVAQIDSDDMWTPRRLEWGLEDMHADSALAASFTSYLRIDAHGAPVPRADQLSIGELDHRALLSRLSVKNTVCACTAVMRREALDAIGPFAQGYALSHDWDRWLRLSLVGNLVMRGTIGAFYRHHDRNQSLDVQSTYREELAIHDALSSCIIKQHQLDAAQQLAIYGRAAALAFNTQQDERLVHYLGKKQGIYPLFEHEQVWLLHLWMRARLQPVRATQKLLQHVDESYFTGDNRQRFAALQQLDPC